MVVLWEFIGHETGASVQCVIRSSSRRLLFQHQFYNMVNFTVYLNCQCKHRLSHRCARAPNGDEWHCLLSNWVSYVALWTQDKMNFYNLYSNMFFLSLSLILNSKCRTLVMGYGTAPPEHLSMLVIIVACVGMGIPFLLLIGGGAYVFVKRARNRWTMQWINGKWMGWMSYDVRYVSSEDRTMMSTNRLRMWTN